MRRSPSGAVRILDGDALNLCSTQTVVAQCGFGHVRIDQHPYYSNTLLALLDGEATKVLVQLGNSTGLPTQQFTRFFFDSRAHECSQRVAS